VVTRESAKSAVSKKSSDRHPAATPARQHCHQAPSLLTCPCTPPPGKRAERPCATRSGAPLPSPAGPVEWQPAAASQAPAARIPAGPVERSGAERSRAPGGRRAAPRPPRSLRRHGPRGPLDPVALCGPVSLPAAPPSRHPHPAPIASQRPARAASHAGSRRAVERSAAGRPPPDRLDAGHIAVIETDHRLEEAAGRTAGELAGHRWHWTLDESNPGRVSISEYARQVGKSQSTISVMAKGYASYSAVNDASSNLDDHVGRARMSGETAAAAEAVARARGVSPRTAQDSRSPLHNEVKRVRDIARDLAEKHGTSIEEEAPTVAEAIGQLGQLHRGDVGQAPRPGLENCPPSGRDCAGRAPLDPPAGPSIGRTTGPPQSDAERPPPRTRERAWSLPARGMPARHVSTCPRTHAPTQAHTRVRTCPRAHASAMPLTCEDATQ
jgi:hypothetical protein